MPTIKHLIQELALLGVKPDDARIPAQVFDDIVAEAEEAADED